MSQFQKDKVQDIYYLSPMQEGMLFHSLLHPGQGFYIEQITIKVKGSFEREILQKSMNVIVDRYDIFRTVFVHEITKRPVQVVLKQRDFKVGEVDLSALPEEERKREIEDYLRKDKEQGFDLSRDIPMRTVIFKKGTDDYEWVWSYHHILLDGWCFGIVVKELFQVYAAIRQNKPYHLPPAKPYKEYIKWLEQQDKQRSLHYWRHYLSGFAGQTTFAEQRVKPQNPGDSDGRELYFKLPEEETRLFGKLAQESHATLSTALQAAWGVLLSRYQRTDDVVFGTVVSGRPAEISGVENMVGLFINVVPKRIRLSEDSTFAGLISDLQTQTLESEAHQYMPLYDIQSGVAQPDLIDHIVVFENYPLQQSSGQQDESGVGFATETTGVYEKSNYDINLLASPGKELILKIAYNAEVYEPAFILRLKDQLLQILREICRNPDARLEEIRIVTDEEERLLLTEFNPEALSDPSESFGSTERLTLTGWFERYAKMTPDQIALAQGEHILTYSELNTQANRLARLLRAQGVNTGTIVAMLVHRSPEMIVGILAILKAGGAYLPIDPEYPEQRIRYMLEDSKAALLLTQQALSGQVESLSYEGPKLFIDDPALYYGVAENLETVSQPDDLAYVIYTSGTTGNPKGTLTTHANITRVVKNTNYIDITGDDILLSLSNYAFDGFTFDLFGALLNGGKLVIAANETILHINKLMQLIEEERITVMFVTTALFNLLVDAGTGWMAGIRKVLFGGERSTVNHVRKALRGMGPGKIIHVYGPTETTVFATFHPVAEIPEDAVTVPIGKPLSQTGAYILGRENQLQPVGAVGELCLSGAGLARGYLNRPDLTAEKFAPHPFLPGQRMYRSGDLARWLPDGSIEFMGRIDDQVKIRGHRIELGEIESRLLEHAGVKEAVVLAARSEAGEAALCAYVVGEPKVSLNPDMLRNFAAETLPGYMVPPSYVLLDKLPLTLNGKVDRRLLPQAPAESSGDSAGKIPPRNEFESKLAGMWSEVLGVRNPGIHDNFFAMGGHSLKAMALCAQILKGFEVDVPVRILFETPTIAGIAAYLQRDEETAGGGCRVEREMTVFNPEGSRNAFAFPPVLGYGIMFGDLAKQLPEFRIHAFDFIEAEDRIRQYADLMLEAQPEGTFVLLGYSAGASLAFEVAQALEERGRIVDKLIMIDGYRKTGISDMEGRTVEEDVEALMEANKNNPYLEIDSIRQGIVQKMQAYYTYYVELISTGKVDAKIHLIKSENSGSRPVWAASWVEATTLSFWEHQGFGKHAEMLQGNQTRLNASIIGQILRTKQLMMEANLK